MIFIHVLPPFRYIQKVSNYAREWQSVFSCIGNAAQSFANGTCGVVMYWRRQVVWCMRQGVSVPEHDPWHRPPPPPPPPIFTTITTTTSITTTTRTDAYVTVASPDHHHLHYHQHKRLQSCVAYHCCYSTNANTTATTHFHCTLIIVASPPALHHRYLHHATSITHHHSALHPALRYNDTTRHSFVTVISWWVEQQQTGDATWYSLVPYTTSHRTHTKL